MSTITIYQKRYDPTHTTRLRNAFARDMRRRFAELTTVITKAIVEQDVFGLNRNITVFQMNIPPYEAFAFPRSEEKVTRFMKWLQDQIDKGLLDVRDMSQVGKSINGAWTNKYIYDSYKRGVIRARYELQKGGYKVPSIDDTGGFTMSMATPFHLDRLGLLYTRTYTELKGTVSNMMDKQISRILSQGIADGDNPRLLARKLVATINGTGMGDLSLTDTLGRFIPAERRAEMLARTEIIRAHHQATINEYKNWAVEGVMIRGEWATAGDDRVCDECEELQGHIFDLDEIMNMIPYHPNCRCAALPIPFEEDNKYKRLGANKFQVYGGEGSGNFGHEGRPGEVGGSGPGGSSELAYSIIAEQVLSKFTKIEEFNDTIVGGVSTKLKEVDITDSLEEGVSGLYDPNTTIISISEKTVSNITPSLTIGAFSVGQDFASSVRHEYGHYVMDKKTTVWRKTAFNKRGESMKGQWEQIFNSRSKVWWKSNLSEYGSSSHGEAFAESFNAYTSPLYKSGMLNKDITNFFDKFLK